MSLVCQSAKETHNDLEKSSLFALSRPLGPLQRTPSWMRDFRVASRSIAFPLSPALPLFFH